MSTLVKVHTQSGIDFYINADKIVWMQRKKESTEIHMDAPNHCTIHTQEHPDSIAGAVILLERGKAASAAEAGR